VTVPEPDQCPDNPLNGLSEPASAWICVERHKSPQAIAALLSRLAEDVEKNEVIIFDPSKCQLRINGICFKVISFP
jgi:hypothetical protein